MQAERDAIQNLLNYHRREFELKMKEREEYIAELEKYIAELEADRKSFRKLTKVALGLVGSRLGLC